ncbi:MAG: hypothetical protein KGO93_09360 [Cyanobacteria bacterium REEB446]|nr:hypothetical protein [Cyanobacteria bacterium REEB446]
MKPSQYQLPKFKNESDFETFCLDLFKAVFKDSSGDKYGRKGQAQHGIDLYFPQAKKVIQCKVRSDKLTLAEVKEDIEKFKSFPHEDYEICFTTTADRDKNLQDECLKLNTQIYGWENLLELLDTNLDIFHRYFTNDEQEKYFNISTIISLANDYYDDLKLDSSLDLLKKTDNTFETLSRDFKYQISLLKAKIFETKYSFFADPSIRDEISKHYLKVSTYREEGSIEKHLNKAKAYFTINESRRGLDELEEALRIDPENEQATNLKIMNLSRKKDLEIFLQGIDPLFKLKPSYKASLAVFYYKNKNYNKAKELLEATLQSSDELKNLQKLGLRELLHECIFFSEPLGIEKYTSEKLISNLKSLIPKIQNLWRTIKDKEISKYFTHILLPEINARTLLLKRTSEEQEFNEELKSILSVCDDGLEKCLPSSYAAFCFNHTKVKIYLDLQEYKTAHEVAIKLDLAIAPDTEILLAVAEFMIGKFTESEARLIKLSNDKFFHEEYKTQVKQTHSELFNLPSLLKQAYFLKMTEPTEENERQFFGLIWARPEIHQSIEKLNSEIDKTLVKENVAVKIKTDSGETEFFILETNKKIPSRNKIYHPEHRLFQELLDKKIGDEIVIDRNQIPEKKGIIEDILLKYYGAGNHIEMKDFNRKYPDRPIGIFGTLPDNPSLEDFENFLKTVTERFKRD